jgi:flagellin
MKMGLYVNTNVASLNAQRNLNSASRTLTKSFQRLSSGLRINSAKDDAAGLGISDRMTSQVRGLNQAMRNTNDGVSLAQTAEGGLSESTAILQRVRELAVQSANDTNTTQDRESIQNEVDQLVSELDRIGSKTTFNGQTVLDGSFIGAKFHVGSNASETVTVSIKDARSGALGRQARVTSDTFITQGAGEELLDDEVVINAVTIRATGSVDDQLSTAQNSSSAIAKAAAINDASEFTGVRAIVEATEVVGTSDIGSVTLDSTNNLSINGEIISGFHVENNDADDALVEAINAVSENTGVVATLDQDNRLTLTADDGRNIEVVVAGAASNLGIAIGGGGAAAVFGGQVTLQSDAGFTVTGAGVGKLGNVGGGGSLFGTNGEFAVSTIDVTTREGANTAIDTVDVAISQVSNIRGELGAVQNRLESTINNLAVSAENVSAARSRILDADFATETASFSRNQIIQQAGISVLAQANQQPQVALALLG